MQTPGNNSDLKSLSCTSFKWNGSPSGLRQRLFIRKEDLGENNRELIKKDHITECLLLNTCNRFEAYIVAEPFRSGRDSLFSCLSGISGLPPDSLEAAADHFPGIEAARHLFEVACGLDSMVIGEKQILGQLKHSYRVALENGATGSILNRLLQRCFYVAKKIRSETGIDRGAHSVASLAVQMLEQRLAGLEGKRALIIGAGETGKIAAKHLRKRGVAELALTTRTYEHARQAARDSGARPVPFAMCFAEMRSTDIVVCATASPHEIVGFDDIREVMSAKAPRTLHIVDLAVPNDVDPGVARIKGVQFIALEQVDDIARETKRKRLRQAQAAQPILLQELNRFRVRP